MFAAIVPAAGKGTRMGQIAVSSKQLLPLAGLPVVVRTLQALSLPEIDAIVLVVPAQQLDEFRVLTKKYKCGKVKWVIPGGNSRQESVRLGLKVLPSEYTHVVIHDGGRPLVTKTAVLRCMQAALQTGAATVAVPAKDTIKSSIDGRFVHRTLKRESLWLTQTPQAFVRRSLEQWHDEAAANGLQVTDDATLAEIYGHSVQLVMGDYGNLKLTTPEDLVAAEALLHYMSGGNRMSASVGSCANLRVGIGYDVHQLAPGRKLVLGGVEVPCEVGLSGHSDADVALHALMDALLGASGLGDIGQHFPDTDPKYAGSSSLDLLSAVVKMLAARGYRIINADITIAAQRPKLVSYIPAMCERTACVCEVPTACINYKATTTEGLGFVGEGRGISAYAVCLLAHAN